MKILYFAPIYYDDMKQRPQYIAEYLAKRHTVYYVEPTVSFIRWLLKGGRSFVGEKKRIGRLTVLRLNGSLTFHKSIEILDLCGVNNWSELFQLQNLIKKCDLVWVGYSGWYTLTRHIHHKPVIFDKMDEEDMLVSSRLLKMTLRRNKRKITHRADAVFVTSRKFYTDLKKSRDNVYLVPNAVSDHFTCGLDEDEIAYGALSQAKVFGYIGMISEWFDTEVVYKLLELDAHYEIVLVGRNCLPEIRNPRVHYLGIKENLQLAQIIQTFDVCLYNFRKLPVLDTINPVKIYEYLSLNKPVLAVKSKETCKLHKYVMLYETADEIEKLLDRSIHRPFSNPQKRKEFLRKNSWSARMDTIEKILREESRKNDKKSIVGFWNKAGSN